MENQVLLPRIKDAIDFVQLNDRPKFIGFLSVDQAAFAKKYLENQNVKHLFFGGAKDCERTYLCCFPEWLSNPDFPITAVAFNFPKVYTLTHRDFLGALMSLGIKRETVGDILIEQGRAVIFLNNDIVGFVLENLSKVGNVGIKGIVTDISQLPQKKLLKENVVSLASLRLDCVVSAFANCSRNNAVSLIQSGFVAVNSVKSEKPTKLLTDNDVLSIRHKGKFKIVSSDKRTKKDRIVLVYKNY